MRWMMSNSTWPDPRAAERIGEMVAANLTARHPALAAKPSAAMLAAVQALKDRAIWRKHPFPPLTAVGIDWAMPRQRTTATAAPTERGLIPIAKTETEMMHLAATFGTAMMLPQPETPTALEGEILPPLSMEERLQAAMHRHRKSSGHMQDAMAYLALTGWLTPTAERTTSTLPALPRPMA